MMAIVKELGHMQSPLRLCPTIFSSVYKSNLKQPKRILCQATQKVPRYKTTVLEARSLQPQSCDTGRKC